MINNKSTKHPKPKPKPNLSHSPRVSFKSRQLSQSIQKSSHKQRFSIQQLLNQSSIQKIQTLDLGRRSSRRDLVSQSPEHWIGDTSKQNINILIMTQQKEIDLFENVLNDQFSLDEDNTVQITNENENMNYQKLQMEYERLMKQGMSYSSDEKQQEQIIGKILNVSQIEQKKREDDMFGSRRESVIDEKIEDFVKIVRRIVNIKTDNKILNSSINISRHSQYKQSITKNLFEINEELDNLQGTNKAQRVEEDDETGFYLKDHINNRVLQEDMFKGSGEIQNDTTNDNQRKRQSASSKIKNYWKKFKSQQTLKSKINYKSVRIQQVKIEQDEPHPLQIVEKQQDFNHILNQLDESSNNINNKSQQLSLQYKQLIPTSNKNIIKVNSNSFCEQKRKKVQGDSLVLEHLGSISAIRSTSKFRQASQYDDSQIKQQDSRYYYDGVDDMLRRRQFWIRQKTKQNMDQNWRRKQLELIEKLRKIVLNPYQICIPLTKQVSVNTIQAMVIDKRGDHSFDFKDLPRLKQSFRNPRTLIQRKNKQVSNSKVNFTKQKDKEITYIEDKRINIILTKQQVRKLMSRQTISNELDIFNQNQDLSVQTEQILTQLNFSQNQIAPVKTRRIKYNIQLQERSFNDSIGK